MWKKLTTFTVCLSCVWLLITFLATISVILSGKVMAGRIFMASNNDITTVLVFQFVAVFCTFYLIAHLAVNRFKASA
jgi:hypothetical protein